MKIRSYAKVNLTLDILGKREDGFHELETVFQQVGLYDEVELLEIDSGIEIECNVENIANSNNLAYKAAELLIEKKGISKGVKIHVKKNIPIGAGLSGGSSNAAAVLKGMNLLFDLSMSKDELIKFASELGSDAAFHIIGGTCLGKGRGEKLEILPDFPKHDVTIVFPGFGVNTKQAYSKLDYDKIGKVKSSEKFIKDYDLQYLHNDFEYSVSRDNPKIAEVKKDINGMLSGSGSCVFALRKVDYDKYRVFHTKTINKRISLAKEMGFCFGVKRAIEEIEKLSKVKKVCVLGKLIHNPQVIGELGRKGIQMLDDFHDVDSGTLVISAHGISDKTKKEIKDKGLQMVDLTCPLVEKVHITTKEEQKKGRKIIVYGDKKHTEVKGIVGNLQDYKVIKDIGELSKEDLDCKITLVSQTTREVGKFEELAEKIKDLCDDVEIKDTICIATKERQSSSIDLAKSSDIMIVIGGKISSNTGRLAEICSQFCETKHIETEKELNPEWFLGKEMIGITAGASTPDDIIERVKSKIEEII